MPGDKTDQLAELWQRGLLALNLMAKPSISVAWLLILYAGVAWIAIGTLSAIQMREAIQRKDNQLTFTGLEWEQEKLARLRKDQRQNIDEHLTQIKDLSSQIAPLELKKQEELSNFARTLDIYPDDLDKQTKVDYLKERCLDSSKGIAEKIKEKCDQYKKIGDGHDKGLSPLKGNLKFLQEAVDELSQKLEKFEESAYAVLIPAWKFMNKLGYKSLLTMPNEILVLLLTMTMGALGSVVQMTWSFIRHDSGVNFRRYFFLPFVGTISAFIIFVFLKAGQITITSGAQTQSLDPFLLSFIGIISGLLSEHAYERMESVGHNFFRTGEERTGDEDQLRWGVRLREAMQDAKVSSADLAKYVDLDQPQVESLVEQKSVATWHQQRLIAACLRQNMRDLFTDVPPDTNRELGETGKPVVMPNLVGKDTVTLEQDVAEAGLVLGETQMKNSEQPRGRVISHTPSAGEPVAAHSPVNVTVSSGSAS